MDAVIEDQASPPPGLSKIVWNWRHNPKLELWLAWYTIVIFYNIFAICFFGLTRTQPPPKAWWDLPKIVWWFHDKEWGLLFGFGIMFLMGAFAIASTALISYSIRRMSVSPAFAYSYLILYSLAAERFGNSEGDCGQWRDYETARFKFVSRSSQSALTMSRSRLTETWSASRPSMLMS